MTHPILINHILPLYKYFFYSKRNDKGKVNFSTFNPIRTGGGGGVSTRLEVFLPITFKVINLHSRNLVTFPKI